MGHAQGDEGRVPSAVPALVGIERLVDRIVARQRDYPLARVVVNDTEFVHPRKVVLAQGGSNRTALVVGESARIDTVLLGGDPLCDVRGACWPSVTPLEGVQRVPPPMVAQHLEHVCPGHRFTVGRRSARVLTRLAARRRGLCQCVTSLHTSAVLSQSLTFFLVSTNAGPDSRSLSPHKRSLLRESDSVRAR